MKRVFGSTIAATALALSSSLAASPEKYYQYIVCEGERAAKPFVVVGQYGFLEAKNEDENMRAFEQNLGVLMPRFVNSGGCKAHSRGTYKAASAARHSTMQDYAEKGLAVYKVPELSRSADTPFGIHLGRRNYRMTDGQPWAWETREVTGGDKPYPTKRHDVARVQEPDGIFRKYVLYTADGNGEVTHVIATRTFDNSEGQLAFPERRFEELVRRHRPGESAACDEHDIVGFHHFAADDGTARAHGVMDGGGMLTDIYMELSATYTAQAIYVHLEYRLGEDRMLKTLKEGSQRRTCGAKGKKC